MKTPDVTPLQLGALVAALIRVLVVFGVDVSPEQAQAINDLVMTFIAVVGADAIVRVARNLRREPIH